MSSRYAKASPAYARGPLQLSAVTTISWGEPVATCRINPTLSPASFWAAV